MIRVPSLDERKDDIPLLIRRFLEDIASEYGAAVKKIDPKAIQMLQERSWSGNIRELRNVVERLVILSKEKILPEDVQMYAAN